MADTSRIFAKATSNKAGALKHPTARAFSPEEWSNTLAAIENPSERDITLTISAIWFGQQIRLLRRHADHILAPLSRRDAVVLAVAQLNREYATLQQRMARARHEERKQEVVDLHLASQRLISTGYPGNQLPADDLNDALVDTLPVWLHQAFLCSTPDSLKGCDLTQIGVNALRAFTLERTLSKLWQQCLWLDWKLGKDGQQLTLAPDDQAAETLRHAWLFRQQGIATQYSFVDLAAESAAKKANLKAPRLENRTIIAQENSTGRRRDFITGRATSRCASYLQNHMWTSVETSYVGMFIDTPLPKLGLSCNQLQKVWCIVADACGILSKRCGESRPVDASTIRDWALTCARSNLSQAISVCSNLSSADTELAIGFLTYDGSDFRRGVWSMPLIQLPDHGLLLMCRSPLEIGNPVRRVEQWLERGGLSDQLSGAQRGSSYETWVRNEIATCLARNPLLQDVASISSPLKPADRSIGDIDAAFRIRDLIVVVEVKCLLTPAEPIEQHRYRNKLEDAAKQAIRKATWLADNISSHRSDFGLLGSEAVEIKPIVLTNQGYGLSLEIDGCLVCDFHTLSSYLRDNTILIGGAFSGLSGRTGYTQEKLYYSEEGARRGLLQRIRNAPTLRRYIDRTTWAQNLVPCYHPPLNSLAVAGARLSDAVDDAARSAAFGLTQ
ncbi:Nuclease-related domain superfamily [Neorhizobium galegae bv. orientalis]|nr:Nuclease-related domain superfamily [Neorhizobium galegae bv. orientalis]